MDHCQPIFSRAEFITILIVLCTITALLTLYANEKVTQISMVAMPTAVFIIGGGLRAFIRSRRRHRSG